MSYNGFEIDMLSLGDADSILVTRWADGVATRVLVDGGDAGDSAKVRAFLSGLGVSHIDHLVCSHLHDDHAAGLIGLVNDPSLSFGQAWLHVPAWHIDVNAARAALSEFLHLETVQKVQASLDTQVSLHNALVARSIPISEPFAGKAIGPLVVCGPREEYYEELLAQFTDIGKLRERADAMAIEDAILKLLLEKAAAGASDSLLDDPKTSPENNSSTILGTVYNDQTHVFTADAGAEALRKVAADYKLAGCHWLQLPHHGSRRNIDQPLVELFAPKVAFASAAGNDKHPRRAVVNAFKKAGAKVYSTHYPNGGPLWHHRGDVPERPTYVTATPLWEKDK